MNTRAVLAGLVALSSFAQAEPLAGTKPLEHSGDLSAEMVAGSGLWAGSRDRRRDCRTI